VKAQGRPSLGFKSVIYIFLSGGLAQHDSFDPKPDAPDIIRGEFAPIRTRIPRRLDERAPAEGWRSAIDKWAMVRSLTHPSKRSFAGPSHHADGRSQAPLGFNPSVPRPNDFRSIASIAGNRCQVAMACRPEAVVPFQLHYITQGASIPGQFRRELGHRHDPWLIQASHNCPGYGPCPRLLRSSIAASRPCWHAGVSNRRSCVFAGGPRPGRASKAGAACSISCRVSQHQTRSTSPGTAVPGRLGDSMRASVP